jgi:hypothetical protein
MIKTKVTRINKRFHCRLIDIHNNIVLDEMACKEKCDIGFCFSEMLRWQNKLGSSDKMAESSRNRRIKKFPKSIGKIWYKNELRK